MMMMMITITIISEETPSTLHRFLECNSYEPRYFTKTVRRILQFERKAVTSLYLKYSDIFILVFQYKYTKPEAEKFTKYT